MDSNMGVSPQEERALLQLCSMFENVDCSTILDSLRSNNGDVEATIDQLLSLPEPTPQEPEEPSSRPSSVELPVAPSPPPFDEQPPRISTPPHIELLSERAERMLAKKKKIEEKIQKRAQKMLVKKQRQQAKEKRRADFGYQEKRPARTISDPALPLPTKVELASEPVSYAQPPSISQDRESQLLQVIADLRAENGRLEEEKRNAMKWVINEMRNQVADRDAQLAAKDKQLDENERKMEELKDQIHKLQDAFRESKSKENRLGKLLLSSKDVIVEGVLTLSKNVTQATGKGWAKVQKELMKEEKELHVLEKMKEFAQSLKEEISKVIQGEPKAIQANVDQVDGDEQVEEEDNSTSSSASSDEE